MHSTQSARYRFRFSSRTMLGGGTSRAYLRRGWSTLQHQPNALSYPRRSFIPVLMKIRIGILGMPNVGKSSLFNALAQKSIAQAANFPFCTIEPNVATVALPDNRLQSLGTLANSLRTVHATLDWLDVAGLARGASRGEGLGNKFLGELRECDALAHVVRDFDSVHVVHVDGIVDPVCDAETINLELLLADLEHVERRFQRAKGTEKRILETVVACLREGKPARAAGLSESEKFAVKSMGLSTMKPVLYCFNVDEVDFTYGREEAVSRCKKVLSSLAYCDSTTDKFALVSAKIESDICELDESQQIAYFDSLGFDIEDGESTGSFFSHNALPRAIAEMLGLSIVYTGPGVPQERSRTTRAHMFPAGSLTAEGLAGRIHDDLQKGFIRAEVIQADKLMKQPSYTASKEAGCVRVEGRDYALCSGEVVLIKWKRR